MRVAVLEQSPYSWGEGNFVNINLLVVHGKPLGFYLLLGINVIKALGGIVVRPTGLVQIGDWRATKGSAISINELYFFFF